MGWYLSQPALVALEIVSTTISQLMVRRPTARKPMWLPLEAKT
jgi:hypothetical protein